MKFRVPGIILGILLLGVSLCFSHGDEEVAEDQIAVKSTGYWIYNDIDKGFAEAEKTGHPLLIVFRCRLTESGIIAYVLQEEPQTKTLPVKMLRNGEQVEVELSLE